MGKIKLRKFNGLTWDDLFPVTQAEYVTVPSITGSNLTSINGMTNVKDILETMASSMGATDGIVLKVGDTVSMNDLPSAVTTNGMVFGGSKAVKGSIDIDDLVGVNDGSLVQGTFYILSVVTTSATEGNRSSANFDVAIANPENWSGDLDIDGIELTFQAKSNYVSEGDVPSQGQTLSIDVYRDGQVFDNLIFTNESALAGGFNDTITWMGMDVTLNLAVGCSITDTHIWTINSDGSSANITISEDNSNDYFFSNSTANWTSTSVSINNGDWLVLDSNVGGVRKWTVIHNNISDALALKVNTADIINSLTLGGTTKVLSAEQGKILKTLVDDSSVPVVPYNGDTIDAQHEVTDKVVFHLQS